MQNQDPLNPMDNAQVTSQIAQINTVTGIDKLNTTVQGLSSQFMQLQAMQGASLVGHDVIVAGNKLERRRRAAIGQGGFELANAADAVKVEILGAGGAVVQTLNLGAEGAGMHSFDWPSRHGDERQRPDLPRHRDDAAACRRRSTPLMRDRVDAISTDGTSFNLELENSGTGRLQRRQGLQLDPCPTAARPRPQKANTPWVSSKVFPV